MKPSYRFGVEWIAANDDAACKDVDMIAKYISTALLADLFGKDRHLVARDIFWARASLGSPEDE